MNCFRNNIFIKKIHLLIEDGKNLEKNLSANNIQTNMQEAW
jgi:hypothetical protein